MTLRQDDRRTLEVADRIGEAGHNSVREVDDRLYFLSWVWREVVQSAGAKERVIE